MPVKGTMICFRQHRLPTHLLTAAHNSLYFLTKDFSSEWKHRISGTWFSVSSETVGVRWWCLNGEWKKEANEVFLIGQVLWFQQYVVLCNGADCYGDGAVVLLSLLLNFISTVIAFAINVSPQHVTQSSKNTPQFACYSRRKINFNLASPSVCVYVNLFIYASIHCWAKVEAPMFFSCKFTNFLWIIKSYFKHFYKRKNTVSAGMVEYSQTSQ